MAWQEAGFRGATGASRAGRLRGREELLDAVGVELEAEVDGRFDLCLWDWYWDWDCDAWVSRLGGGRMVAISVSVVVVVPGT